VWVAVLCVLLEMGLHRQTTARSASNGRRMSTRTTPFPCFADVDRARHGAVGHKTSLDVQLNRGSFRRQTKKGVAMRQFFLLI